MIQSAGVEPIPSLRRRVGEAIQRAWKRAIESGGLPSADASGVEVQVARPADPTHGDLATNLALKLARPYRRGPMDIAAVIVEALRDEESQLVGDVQAAAPGFVNIRLADTALAADVSRIIADPDAWGRVIPDRPRHVNVEFVSANPTGPLHIGNARGAFVGDLLCRILEAGGHTTTREYYFNDFGAQVRNLGASVLALRTGSDVPEDGYHGGYVGDLARNVPDEVWVEATADGADGPLILGRWASERVRVGIEASLASLGVRFDVWRSESTLHDDGWVQQAIERLRAGGHLYEQDGALWFASTAFGDDKDRVVMRSNGEPTYFAADIGYVVEKFGRGYDELIYIWGADHHGTVARVRNAASAMGYDRDHVRMLLTGWVRFIRDGVEVSMSKRAGTFITLDELLAEVGPDAARWFFASRGANLDIDFDIELAKKQSNENPVYYVQYAHARIASILRKAADAGLAPGDSVAGLLGEAADATLVREVLRFPEVIEDAATAEETQGVTTYATELATRFHAFYRDARVIDADEPARSAQRLALCVATKITLARALGLLGIEAPEAM